VLARSFDSASCIFHTVFNRIVENCHKAFTISALLLAMMARELLPRIVGRIIDKRAALQDFSPSAW